MRERLRRFDDRLVFVIGSPRSGTTFLGATIGGLPGFVDLGEVQPLKAAIPELFGLDEDTVAHRIRRILQAQRIVALVPGVRGVEQGPETVFVFPAALRTYPDAWIAASQPSMAARMASLAASSTVSESSGSRRYSATVWMVMAEPTSPQFCPPMPSASTAA